MGRSLRDRSTLRAVTLIALFGCTTPQRAEVIEFQLHDVQGREVRSQDYKGRPLFLEFGACW